MPPASLREFVESELFGTYAPGSNVRQHGDRVDTLLSVPIQLERYLWFGTLVCADHFLFVFTLLPLRVLLASGAFATAITRFALAWLVSLVSTGFETPTAPMWSENDDRHGGNASLLDSGDRKEHVKVETRRSYPTTGHGNWTDDDGVTCEFDPAAATSTTPNASAKSSTSSFKNRHSTQAFSLGMSPFLPSSASSTALAAMEEVAQQEMTTNSAMSSAGSTSIAATSTLSQNTRRVPSVTQRLQQLVVRGTHWCDAVRFVVLLVTCAALNAVDSSIIYHVIRGQSVIKLTVIFNALEVLDKLCRSFGHDIFEHLYWTTTGVRQRSVLSLTKHVTMACVFSALHAYLLLVQVTALNVAVNSHKMMLFTLLVSNQFLEVKSTVFKNCSLEALGKHSRSDVIERFQLCAFLFIVVSKNSSDVRPADDEEFWASMFSAVAWVALTEIGVDWIKHSFITSFNQISPRAYIRMKLSLCRILIDTDSTITVPDSSFLVTRHVGFVALPLACVVLSVAKKQLLRWLFRDWVATLVVWFILCVCKILTRVALYFFTVRFIATHNHLHRAGDAWDLAFASSENNNNIRSVSFKKKDL